MKKLFTVLFAVFAVSGIYAQSGRHDGYAGSGRDRYDAKDTRPMRMPDRFDRSEWMRARDAQLNGINREFDSRIAAVKYRRNLSQREKRRLIAVLERERQDQLKM